MNDDLSNPSFHNTGIPLAAPVFKKVIRIAFVKIVSWLTDKYQEKVTTNDARKMLSRLETKIDLILFLNLVESYNQECSMHGGRIESIPFKRSDIEITSLNVIE